MTMAKKKSWKETEGLLPKSIWPANMKERRASRPSISTRTPTGSHSLSLVLFPFRPISANQATGEGFHAAVFLSFFFWFFFFWWSSFSSSISLSTNGEPLGETEMAAITSTPRPTKFGKKITKKQKKRAGEIAQSISPAPQPPFRPISEKKNKKRKTKRTETPRTRITSAGSPPASVGVG